MNKMVAGILVWVLAVGAGWAMDEDEIYGPQPGGEAAVEAWDAENRARYADNPDVLLLPGLVADRSERKVEIRAESTGLSPDEPIEFLLIDVGSSHGYEALLWSHALPSDVHRALVFIGLQPGESFNPNALRFWPTGDRVLLDILRADETATFPIERLVWDREREDTLPEEGYVFAGSIETVGPDGKMLYVADRYDPRSVASIYNEPAAVLDVPRRVSQGEAYGNQVVNPEGSLPAGEIISIIMQPAEKEGGVGPRELRLSVQAQSGTNLQFRLLDAEGQQLSAHASLSDAMEQIIPTREENQALYLELDIGDGVPLADVGQISRSAAAMEMMGVARIEPPVEGQLFYRAFLPDPAWADPGERPTQPWELHLQQVGDKLKGAMVWYEQVWEDGVLRPRLEPHRYAVSRPQDVRNRLAQHAQEREAAGESAPPQVLLVAAPAGLTYGELLAFLRPALETHGTVYVFLDQLKQLSVDDATEGDGE